MIDDHVDMSSDFAGMLRGQCSKFVLMRSYIEPTKSSHRSAYYYFSYSYALCNTYMLHQCSATLVLTICLMSSISKNQLQLNYKNMR